MPTKPATRPVTTRVPPVLPASMMAPATNKASAGENKKSSRRSSSKPVKHGENWQKCRTRHHLAQLDTNSANIKGKRCLPGIVEATPTRNIRTWVDTQRGGSPLPIHPRGPTTNVTMLRSLSRSKRSVSRTSKSPSASPSHRFKKRSQSRLRGSQMKRVDSIKARLHKGRHEADVLSDLRLEARLRDEVHEAEERDQYEAYCAVQLELKRSHAGGSKTTSYARSHTNPVSHLRLSSLSFSRHGSVNSTFSRYTSRVHSQSAQSSANVSISRAATARHWSQDADRQEGRKSTISPAICFDPPPSYRSPAPIVAPLHARQESALSQDSSVLPLIAENSSLSCSPEPAAVGVGQKDAEPLTIDDTRRSSTTEYFDARSTPLKHDDVESDEHDVSVEHEECARFIQSAAETARNGSLPCEETPSMNNSDDGTATPPPTPSIAGSIPTGSGSSDRLRTIVGITSFLCGAATTYILLKGAQKKPDSLPPQL